MHSPVRSNCRRQRAANANDFVTFKWTCNHGTATSSGSGNCRLCFVGQLMNHLMENAIPDFRFVCPWLALSQGFMSALVATSPFRSILNCCHIFALGIGFLLATRNVCSDGVLAADKPLNRNYFNTRMLTKSFHDISL